MSGPILVYSFPLAPGQYTPSAVRVATGTISHVPSPFSVQRTDVGTTEMKLEGGRNLVDGMWARGKKWWWTGVRR